jgi:hypothetical protein
MKHEWTLSWFDAQDEHFVGDKTFETLSDEQVAKILCVPVAELLGGEWPIDVERGQRLQTATGYAPALDQYVYLLGATAG